MVRCNYILGAFFAALTLFQSADLTKACQVPVFRYALERWTADTYRLAVFHNGPLSDEQQDVVSGVGYDVNLELLTIDTDEMSAAERIRFGDVQVIKGEMLGRLYYPIESRLRDTPIWEGALTRKVLMGIVDSPVRRRIARDILAGESAVWVILNSGNREADDRVKKTLNRHIDSITQWLEIPEGVAGPGELERVASGEVAMEDVLRSTIPLKISFTSLVIDRNDPAEKFFIKMLTGFVPSLIEQYPSQPLVFPVFGRGRTLDGISEEMLNEELMAAAGSYICGACSCEVKRENPGIDLVMTMEWNEVIEGSAVVVDKKLPPLEGVGDLVATVNPLSSSAAVIAHEELTEGASASERSWPVMSYLGIFCLFALLGLAAFTFFYQRQSH